MEESTEPRSHRAKASRLAFDKEKLAPDSRLVPGTFLALPGAFRHFPGLSGAFRGFPLSENEKWNDTWNKWTCKHLRHPAIQLHLTTSPLTGLVKGM